VENSSSASQITKTRDISVRHYCHEQLGRRDSIDQAVMGRVARQTVGFSKVCQAQRGICLDMMVTSLAAMLKRERIDDRDKQAFPESGLAQSIQ
jgi:hypothetical protein